ncbi:nicotinate-nucleotide pyrophosphorylase [carboxylating], chloroplastic [Trifolium repens]|nr:nicotinate-nucleotide pyrophosphorylase [carboxylating], chloroplastic [Trifolium repens]
MAVITSTPTSPPSMAQDLLNSLPKILQILDPLLENNHLFVHQKAKNENRVPTYLRIAYYYQLSYHSSTKFVFLKLSLIMILTYKPFHIRDITTKFPPLPLRFSCKLQDQPKLRHNPSTSYKLFNF